MKRSFYVMVRHIGMSSLQSVTRPSFPYRVFLSFLERAEGGRKRGPIPVEVSPHVLAQLRKITGTPSFPTMLSDLQIRDWSEILVPGGDGPRPARLYRPRGKVRGVVLFLHGGGFVHCDLVSHHGICCRLARQSGAMVLSLDYRLAPENRFPAAVEDAWAALLWLAEQAKQYHLPIAVAGDSAGGNLSALMALRARDEGWPHLAAQVLFYPAVSGARAPLSRLAYADGFMLTQRLLEWYGNQYLNDVMELTDPGFAPVFAQHFDHLAPALIMTAKFDPLCGEGEMYCELLREAGTPVEYRCFRHAIHGFLNAYALTVDGRRAIRLAASFLKREFVELPG
ncbi:alpha/beta hydrolase [Kozakia baliensis]|nr:alpha/beta hydrolase [Kozakia baliensis]